MSKPWRGTAHSRPSSRRYKTVDLWPAKLQRIRLQPARLQSDAPANARRLSYQTTKNKYQAMQNGIKPKVTTKVAVS